MGPEPSNPAAPLLFLSLSLPVETTLLPQSGCHQGSFPGPRTSNDIGIVHLIMDGFSGCWEGAGTYPGQIAGSCEGKERQRRG